MSKLEFQAIIPQLTSSIQIPGGEGEAIRLKIDCYDMDASQLASFRGKNIKVTFEEVKR
jgi:hypothetical protein